MKNGLFQINFLFLFIIISLTCCYLYLKNCFEKKDFFICFVHCIIIITLNYRNLLNYLNKFLRFFIFLNKHHLEFTLLHLFIN